GGDPEGRGRGQPGPRRPARQQAAAQRGTATAGIDGWRRGRDPPPHPPPPGPANGPPSSGSPQPTELTAGGGTGARSRTARSGVASMLPSAASESQTAPAPAARISSQSPNSSSSVGRNPDIWSGFRPINSEASVRLGATRSGWATRAASKAGTVEQSRIVRAPAARAAATRRAWRSVGAPGGRLPQIATVSKPGATRS